MKNTLIIAENLNQKAYERIKEAILQNELLPGTRLVDSQIAEMFGISRTPVRDAIQILTREGLVENKEKKGYYVFDASPGDINEIYDIRLMIDKEVITKIITVLLPADNKRYVAEIDKIYASTEKKDKGVGAEFIESDEIFHDSIISLCDNSRLIKMYGDIRNQTKVFRQITSYNKERITRATDMHKKMLTAIKDMKLNLALEATTEHVELSRKDAMSDVHHLKEFKRDNDLQIRQPI